MSLPAVARHRWGLDDGGEVGFLDLGDAVVILRESVDVARNQLLDAVTPVDWADARAGFGDEDLADE